MKRQHWVILLIIALVVYGVWFYTRGTTERDQLGEDREPEQVQNGDDEEPDAGQDERLSLSNYFLTEQGLRLNFVGEGYAHADRITWVAHKTNNIVQHMEESAATTIAKVYDVSDTEIVLIFSQEEVYDPEENFTDEVQRNRSKSIIRTPIEVGNTWEDDEMTYEIEAVDEPVTVPYGTFDAIRVRERRIDGNSETVNYYAVRYGLIKSIFTGDNYEVIIQLESVEE